MPPARTARVIQFPFASSSPAEQFTIPNAIQSHGMDKVYTYAATIPSVSDLLKYIELTTSESGALSKREGVMATEGEVRAAEIAASEARTDTKIARLEGKLDLVLESVRSSRDEARDNRRAVIANAWVIFGALIVFVGIIVTIAPAILDFGFKWRETISKEVHDQVQKLPNSTLPK